MKKDNRTDAADTKAAQTYTRAQLASSQRFAARRDALLAVLAEDMAYTPGEAEALIEQYRKGAVR